MLLRDIFKFTKPSLEAFCPFVDNDNRRLDQDNIYVEFLVDVEKRFIIRD